MRQTPREKSRQSSDSHVPVRWRNLVKGAGIPPICASQGGCRCHSSPLGTWLSGRTTGSHGIKPSESWRTHLPKACKRTGVNVPCPHLRPYNLFGPSVLSKCKSDLITLSFKPPLPFMYQPTWLPSASFSLILELPLCLGSCLIDFSVAQNHHCLPCPRAFAPTAPSLENFYSSPGWLQLILQFFIWISLLQGNFSYTPPQHLVRYLSYTHRKQ